MTNPYMPGIVKIGKTGRKQLSKRMKELYTTGVPVPFECVYAIEISHDQMDKLEKTLHEAFAPNRINENREFFNIDPKQAKIIMQFVDGMKDATSVVEKEIHDKLDVQDIAASNKARTRRPPLNFHLMGLHDGDVLVFEHDPKVTCIICGPKKVLVDDHESSLTALTTKLLNRKMPVQPTPHWKFGDRNLSDIYDECFPLPEDED